MNIDFSEYSLGGTVGGYSSGRSLPRKPTNPVLDKSHPLARGLVGAWLFDRPSGTAVRDFSGGGNIGTANSASWVVDAVTGAAFSFNGTDGKVDIDEKTVPAIAAAKVGTVACWIKASVLDRGMIYSEGNTGNDNSVVALESPGTSTQIQLWLRDDTGSTLWASGALETTSGPVDGQWHHIVATVDATEGRIYVDGALEDSVSVGSIGMITCNRATIGCLGRASDVIFFEGLASSVEVWDRAIDAGEVLRLYRDGFGRYKQPENNTAFAVAASSGYTPDLDDTGWTTIPSAGYTDYYVDATSGSDSNDGLTSGAPKQTISSAISAATAGTKFRILLKRGGDFTAQGIVNITSMQGQDADNPCVMATYDSGDMPVVRGLASTSSGATLSDAHFFDLDIQPTTGNYGVQILGTAAGMTNLRFEGCRIQGGSANISIQYFYGSTKIDGVVLFRNRILDSTPDGGHSQGAFFDGVDNLVLEENILDHNGWVVVGDQTVYNHNCYIQYTCGTATFRRNFTSRASSHGIHQRSGGANDDNTYYQNGINGQMGYQAESAPQASGHGRRNVIIEGRDINTSPRSWGFYLTNIASPEFTYNILAHVGGTPSDPRGISMFGSLSGIQSADIRKNIIYKWQHGIEVNGTDAQLDAIGITENDVQLKDGGQPLYLWQSESNGDIESADNRFYSPDIAASRYYNEGDTSFATIMAAIGDTTSTEVDLSGVYTDPEKDMDGYAVSIGLADADALLTYIRLQRKGNWDLNLTPDRINAYFRANFDMRPAPSSLTATKDNEDVVLTWDAIPEAESYIVRRRTDGGAWEVIG